MKAPLSWLRDYVDVNLSAEELASRLALTGTEVERIGLVGVSPDGDNLERFVVGKVISCERHPNADKLSVCVVDVGDTESRTIVCGAPNVAAGQTVPVCLPGAILPNGMEIKQAKLRGVASSGMIMSEAELEFEAKSAGILVLPDSWKPGERLADHLPISEWVLDVEVTPNRPDCLSIWGLAREIGAVTAAPFAQELSFPVPTGERQALEDIEVEVSAPDLCPRYAARVIRDVKLGESPAWLKARLSQAGMRPVNNVVDITNYVMWAVGQPLHSFDLERIRGRKIIVRRADPGELMETLDGTSRELTKDMLVIADAEKPSAIAGIMGSADSEVTDETKHILLEAATFSGSSIMRTSSALGLRSESSTRFEKQLDQNLVPLALDLACYLYIQLCGGTVSDGTVDVKAGDIGPWELPLRADRVEAILGKAIPLPEIAGLLTRLGCAVRGGEGTHPNADGDRLTVTIPTFRRDLEREIDLIEEIVRLHGLDLLPSTLPGREEGRGRLSRDQAMARQIAGVLCGAGLSQAITYSFVDSGGADRMRLQLDDERRRVVELANPLSGDQSVMRTMLLPGLLDAVAKNLSVREDRVHLFEIGKTFHPDGDGGGLLPREVRRVGFVLAGPWEADNWIQTEIPTDFYLAKGVVERLLRAMGIAADYERSSEPFLHPGKSALVRAGDTQLGWVGEVHPMVLRNFDISFAALAAELDVEGLLDCSRDVSLFEDLFAFPAVEQDLALVVDNDVPARELVQKVRRAGGDLLREVRVFDLYEGAQVGEGKKSLALRLTFRSGERTLSEAEVNDLRAVMLEALKTEIGAELRT